MLSDRQLSIRGGTIPIPKNHNSGSMEELEQKNRKRNPFLIPNSSFHEQAEEIAIHDS